jgi:uncharacterized membrane protein YadS
LLITNGGTLAVNNQLSASNEREFFMELIWMFIVGIVLFGIISAMITESGRSLQSKFVGMGVLAGKSKNEIISVVGAPNSISALPDDKTILQWMATGYHIALIFNGDVCEGVSHEFANG